VQIDGHPVVRLSAPETGLEALIAPSVGMVGCSLRLDGDELLGQRGGLERYAETGSTFGVPLLYPWANRLDRQIDSPLVRLDPNGLPIHGLLNASPLWRGLELEGDALTARLDFGQHQQLIDVFPFPHLLEVEMTLEPRALSVLTRVIATGGVPVPIAFGWHPYLQIPGVPREKWELTLPVRERLVVDERMIPTGQVEPVDLTGPVRLGDRAFDDGYGGVEEGARFAVAGGGRRIEVEFTSGYPYAQVFAPPGKGLVCFEPMTAPANALESGDGLRTATPGNPFEAVFRISVA
jgi:aldose 1-epimerase